MQKAWLRSGSRVYNRRQEFEHALIDRKTTWMLQVQAILFAAYGITFADGTETHAVTDFRTVIAVAGLSVAVIALFGVAFLIRSKHKSWEEYHDYFQGVDARRLPRPHTELNWGVDNTNTWLTLVPDLLLPLVFIGGWCVILV